MSMLHALYRRLTVSHLLISLGVTLLVVGAKLVFQYFNLEFLSVNPFMTAIISGNIFLLGFLLNSTLRDYKEAEKFPGDFVTSIETMYDECESIYRNTQQPVALATIQALDKLAGSITRWFMKQSYTQSVLQEIAMLTEYFRQLEPFTQANFIVRMKNEQNLIRRNIIRVNVLRDTPFYDTAYTIARLSVFFSIVLFLFISADPFYEYVFAIGIIVFVNIFLVSLIKDLDEPFEYDSQTAQDQADEVSLKPLFDLRKRLKQRTKDLLASQS